MLDGQAMMPMTIWTSNDDLEDLGPADDVEASQENDTEVEV